DHSRRRNHGVEGPFRHQEVTEAKRERREGTNMANETAVVKYLDRLKALAQRIEKAEKVTGGGLPKIEIRSGNFIIDDMPVEGNELEVLVLTAIHANTYYADDWDPHVISLPVCYA